MNRKNVGLIVIAVLAATLLFKVGTALFVAVVHLAWEPGHWWQWSLLCGVLFAACAAAVTRDGAATLLLGLIGLGCGTSLGAIVEPGMDFYDVFLWPF
jgi:hypothetical protein